MRKPEHTDTEQKAIRRDGGGLYAREVDLLASVTPPEGTDVRAVQGRDDPAPVVLGTVVVRA